MMDCGQTSDTGARSLDVPSRNVWSIVAVLAPRIIGPEGAKRRELPVIYRA